MPEYVQVTQADVDALASKLNELGTKLNDKEATVLMGVLAGHSLWTCNGLPDPIDPVVNPARE